MHKILLIEDDQVIRQQIGIDVDIDQGLVGFIETKKGIGYGLKHA